MDERCFEKNSLIRCKKGIGLLIEKLRLFIFKVEFMGVNIILLMFDIDKKRLGK